MTGLSQSEYHPCRVMAAVLGRASDSRVPLPWQRRGIWVKATQCISSKPDMKEHSSQGSTGVWLCVSSDSQGQGAVGPSRKRNAKKKSENSLLERLPSAVDVGLVFVLLSKPCGLHRTWLSLQSQVTGPSSKHRAAQGQAQAG